MQSAPPKFIALEPDDYHAQHVGRTADGRQFFLTTPFVPALSSDAGREFIALYLFDAKGGLLDARIDDLGPRANFDEQGVQRILEERLAELGPFKAKRIKVRPFQVERFGALFGLIPRPPETDDEEWTVEAQPGNYMAFAEPFDSGEYDT